MTRKLNPELLQRLIALYNLRDTATGRPLAIVQSIYGGWSLIDRIGNVYAAGDTAKAFRREIKQLIAKKILKED